ncbi:hypothetical protein LCGC14_3039590 [marine sediment metagenome]|uniref:Uncharacterized protein n=1 Tax=marine sediment metagenome TaxID=412755 RepID=A0A0F8ZG02_9ZZZZ
MSEYLDRELNDPDPLEGVPWLDDRGQPVPEDPAADPEAWEPAPE